MLVGISYYDNGSNNRQVNSVTYGPAGPTQQNLFRVGAIVRNTIVTEVWSLLSPNVTTADVMVTWNESHESKIVGVITFENVDQTNPLGTPLSATGNTSAPSLSVPSAVDEMVFDVVSWANNISVNSGGNLEQWEEDVDPSGGDRDITGAASTADGAAPSVVMSWSDEDEPWAQIAVAIKPVAGNPTESFTQTPTMCQDFELIGGTTVTATLYLNVMTGSMPASPSITGVLKANGSPVANLSTASFAGGILTLTGTVAGDNTVISGQAVSLDVTTAQAGVTFQIEYDELNKASRIDLPTPSVISIDDLALYMSLSEW